MSIFKEFKYKTVLSHCAPQDGKRVATWQPSCQKVFEESGSDRKFLDPSPELFTSRQIRGSVKEMISVFLENGHIFHPLFHKIPEKQYKFQFLLYQGTFVLRKYVILWKKLGPLDE